MTTAMRYAHLHGFASSPRSKKALVVRDAFAARGVPLSVPDLNRPSFADLSIDAMLEEITAMDTPGDPWCMVGSSLGGFLAARWAELHPDRVVRLLLLCPAFDIVARWPKIMPDGAMEKWRRTGRYLVEDADGTPTPLHYAFFEQARAQPAFPHPSCPIVIVHGTRDDRVPIESSRAYAAHPNVRLIEVDDGHDLLASIDVVVREAVSWL